MARIVEPYIVPHLHKMDWSQREVLFSGPVSIQEKYDGYSLYVSNDVDGNIHVSTKGRDGILENPGYFREHMVTIKRLMKSTWEGETIRAELITKPTMVKHTYQNVPGCVVWDVWDSDVSRYTTREMAASQAVLGVHSDFPFPFARELAYVDMSDMGPHQRMGLIRDLFEDVDYKSSLGGKMEGIVIKNYERLDSKCVPACAKFVLPLDFSV